MTEKRQEYLGRSLSRTTEGYLFGVADEYAKQLCTDFGFGELKGANYLVSEKHLENDTILDEDGQRQHGPVLGRLLWLDRPGIKNAVCQLSTHIGTATHMCQRLLRYLVGNPLSNKLRVARWTYRLQLVLRWVGCW